MRKRSFVFSERKSLPDSRIRYHTCFYLYIFFYIFPFFFCLNTPPISVLFYLSNRSVTDTTSKLNRGSYPSVTCPWDDLFDKIVLRDPDRGTVSQEEYSLERLRRGCEDEWVPDLSELPRSNWQRSGREDPRPEDYEKPRVLRVDFLGWMDHQWGWPIHTPIDNWMSYQWSPKRSKKRIGRGVDKVKTEGDTNDQGTCLPCTYMLRETTGGTFLDTGCSHSHNDLCYPILHTPLLTRSFSPYKPVTSPRFSFFHSPFRQSNPWNRECF